MPLLALKYPKPKIRHSAAYQTRTLGVETRLDTEFADADLNKSEFVTFSAGPTLHYGGERLFATLTVLPQIWGWPDQTGTGGRHLDDRERVEIRLKLGTEF